jgi:short-subunit dehydrogenase
MHVAITGASSGIGAAFAREWARRGADLTLVARRGELLRKLAAEIGGKVRCVEADLGDVEHATDWIAAAEQELGPIDVLVNNAGVEIVGATAAVDWRKAEALLRLNLLTPLKLNRAVLPGMIARGRGCLVDISSIAGLATPPAYYYYGASKAGLAAASESLRAELRGTGVHVVTVYPGPIRTDMGERAMSQVEAALKGSPLALLLARSVPWGTADELASRVAGAVADRRPRVIYPSFYSFQRWLPPLARWANDLVAPGR